MVAPDTCSVKACYSKFSADQVATISACKANTTLHPGLTHASFEKVGVFGHSMGGMSSLACAGGSPLGINPAHYGIAAAVSMHTCQDYLLNRGAGNVAVPILFTAGDADKICADGCAAKFYDSVTYPQKAFLDITNAQHSDPTNMGQNREDEAVALYLSCHLKAEECDKVYGPSGKALCGQVQGGNASTCEVKGGKVNGVAGVGARGAGELVVVAAVAAIAVVAVLVVVLAVCLVNAKRKRSSELCVTLAGEAPA